MAGDIESAHVYARYNERKCAMAGWSSVNIRLDPYNAQTEQQPTQYERISAAIMRVVNEAPPAQRAAIKRMEELGPEKALELLIAGNGAGPLPDDQNSANSEPFATPLEGERSDGSVCWVGLRQLPLKTLAFLPLPVFYPHLRPHREARWPGWSRGPNPSL
jgi:hypothetical protein